MPNPHPLPCLPLPRRLNIDRCIIDKFPSSVHSSHYTPGFDMCPCSLTFGNDNRCVVVVIIITIIIFLPQLLFPESSAFSSENFKFLKSWGRCPPSYAPARTPLVLTQQLARCSLSFLLFCFFGPVSCEMGHSTDDGVK